MQQLCPPLSCCCPSTKAVTDTPMEPTRLPVPTNPCHCWAAAEHKPTPHSANRIQPQLSSVSSPEVPVWVKPRLTYLSGSGCWVCRGLQGHWSLQHPAPHQPYSLLESFITVCTTKVKFLWSGCIVIPRSLRTLRR